MRKVFLSIMMLGRITRTAYTSEDFVLSAEEYNLPISYIIENNVEEGEEITVLTCVEKTLAGDGIAETNYKIFCQELERISAKYSLKINYEVIPMYAGFNRSTFNYFFKQIALKLQEEDSIYFDLTFGMKPYNISMFIAISYAVKACKNASIACAFYSQKFNGSKEAEGVNESRLYDLTGLMYLADFAATVKPGDKALADSMLEVMMPEGEV